MRFNAVLALAALLLLGGAGAIPLPAQSVGYDLSVRDARVDRALEELVTLTGISLVFASEVVQDRRTVCRIEGGTPEQLLRCIVEGSGLDFYRLSSGTYVVIRGVEELPAYGSISGLIVDAITGEPLPLATVELADRSVRGRANGAGIFLLPRLLPGPHELLVTQPGYQPLRLPFDVLSARGTRRVIRLDPTVLELDPIVVEGIRDVGGGLNLEGIWQRDDGTGSIPESGEVSQQARTGLGVSRRPLFADLSIQGSAPGEHMVRLDGVPVFDPVSLGRSRSAFSPLALRRITVRKAGFSVEHGSFGGGVIDVEHALSDRSGPGGLTVLADPYAVNGDFSLPLSILGGEGTVMAAARSSIWDLYREPALNRALRDWNEVDPFLMGALQEVGSTFTEAATFGTRSHGSDVGFTDVHAALALQLPGLRRLQASFYRGTNEVATDLLTLGVDVQQDAPDQLILTSDRYSWSNTLGQLRFDWLLGDRVSLEIRGWGSRHVLDHAYGFSPSQVVSPVFESDAEGTLITQLSSSQPAADGNRIQEWGGSVKVDAAPGNGHFLTGGIEGTRTQSITLLQNGFLRSLLSQDRRARGSVFIQDRWRITDRLTLEAGLRTTHLDGGADYSEPRMSLRLDGSSRLIGPWSTKLSAGVYRQFLNQFSLTNVGPSALVPEVRFWLPLDRSIEPPRAHHFAAEVAARPWSGWEIRAEGYYKALDRLLALDYPTLAGSQSATLIEVEQADFVGEAEGVAFGMGARVEWEGQLARFTASYDWSVSERTFPSRFDGMRQPTPWSEPHRLTLQARVPLLYGLSLGAESRNVWGRSWGLRRAYYDFLTLQASDGEIPVGLPEEDALPTLHLLDLGLSWMGHLLGNFSEFRVELRNAQGRRQVLDYSLVPAVPGMSAQPEAFERRPRLLPGTALLLTLRIGM